MKKRRMLGPALCVLLIAVLLTACSSAKSVTGDWRFSDEYLKQGEDYVNAQGESLAELFSKLTLSIYEDGTYVSEYGFVGGDGNSLEKGTYSFEDGVLTLTSESGKTEAYLLKKGALYMEGNDDPQYVRKKT